MSVSVGVTQNSSFFQSVKTCGRIPVAAPILRQALIQATLDPAILRINFVPSVKIGDTEVPLCGIVFATEHAKRLLDIPEARPLRDLDQEALMIMAADSLGLPTLTLTAADINQEPKFSNARWIWSCRARWVSPADRIRILHLLDEHGPARLIDAAGAASGDGISAILAMACRDELEIDLVSVPLGPSTVVRIRRRPEAAK